MSLNTARDALKTLERKVFREADLLSEGCIKLDGCRIIDIGHDYVAVYSRNTEVVGHQQGRFYRLTRFYRRMR